MIVIKKIIEKIKKNKYKILAFLSFTAASYYFYLALSKNYPQIQLSDFFKALENQKINQVIINENKIYFKSMASQWFQTNLGGYSIYTLFTELRKTPNLQFYCQSPSNIVPILTTLLPLTVLFAFPYIYLRKMGKKSYKIHHGINTTENFKHYYGGQKIKTFLKESIRFINQPDAFQKFGLRSRRGILFHGPPGTGKTLLGRILANECGRPFISLSASEFNQVYVGVGAKRVRELFQEARKIPNGCIIFIDEIDALGSRSSLNLHQQNSSTINQLLCEMDGFIQNTKIIVIAATNNLQKVDPALLRPGRFDLLLKISPPNQQERQGIIKTLIETKKIRNNLTEQQLKQIATNTNQWCGADLQNLLNQSGFSALRNNLQAINFNIVKETMELLEKISTKKKMIKTK